MRVERARWLKVIENKFKDDPRVKRFVDEGMDILIEPDTYVDCELFQ